MMDHTWLDSLRALIPGWGRRRSVRPHRSSRGQRARLHVEALEDRLLPSGYTMGGAIAAEYAATANETDAYGHSVQQDLGQLTSNEMYVPGMGSVPGDPRMNTFQGGVIYWSPGTGAHVVYGAIGTEYAAAGGPTVFGLPTTDEANLPTIAGVRVTDFANGAAVYWSAAAGAHVVYGAIGAEYTAAASETAGSGASVQAVLGAPTSDETYVPGMGTVSGDPRMNTFQGGVIYWSPATGAHGVYGAIAAQYQALGGPGVYGLPITDEMNEAGVPGNRVSFFQNGAVTWSAGAGAVGTRAPQAGAAYSPVQGTLFGSSGPAYQDVQQGTAGDCWLLAALAEVAVRDPADITSMFSSDGTTTENGAAVSLYTVRFYNPSGTAQYVVVDSELPAGGGLYDHPVNGVDWVALAEKAYAEANGAGLVVTSQIGTDSYTALNGGDPAWSLEAVTGKSATDYTISGSGMASAWQSGLLLTVGTPALASNATAAPSLNGVNLVSDHIYVVVAYNAATQTFTLFNPWGVNGGYETLPDGATTFCGGTVTATWQQLAADFVIAGQGAGTGTGTDHAAIARQPGHARLRG